jgi:hypothetical protein
MRRKLLLLGVVGAMVAAPIGRSDGGPPISPQPLGVGREASLLGQPVSFTPIVGGSLPLGTGPSRSLMLIGRSRAQTRSLRWPNSLRGYLQQVDFRKFNVLLVVDLGAPWGIRIKSIEPFEGTKLLVKIVPLPDPYHPYHIGPGPQGPSFALVELPKFPVTALYGADVAG